MRFWGVNYYGFWATKSRKIKLMKEITQKCICQIKKITVMKELIHKNAIAKYFWNILKNENCSDEVPISNQITVVAFQSVQLAQASFLQKNQTLHNVFLISVTLRWHRASVACKNESF